MPRLLGERVMLREYKADDIGDIRKWVNDAETTRYLSTRFWPPQTMVDSEEFLSRMLQSSHSAYNFVIADRGDERYIGQLDMFQVDWRLRCGELGMVIGSASDRGQGLGREALELMKLVGITDAEKRIKNYPHQLSGGMRQRIVIAIALACDPELLICDEPTTALDVTIQSKILELIQEIQKKRQLSVIYITHDLGVVAKVADYVNVMYAGKIVESGTVEDVFYDPRHPYTWGLLSAMPDLGTDDERLYTIPGSPPNLLHKVTGDAFAPRNKYALNIDSRLEPPMFKISETHSAATWLLHPKAPKVDMPPELRDRIERMKKEGGIA